MKNLPGLLLCTLGAPALLTILLGLACASGGPKTHADHIALAFLIPLGFLGLPFVPIFSAGIAILEDEP